METAVDSTPCGRCCRPSRVEHGPCATGSHARRVLVRIHDSLTRLKISATPGKVQYRDMPRATGRRKHRSSLHRTKQTSSSLGGSRNPPGRNAQWMAPKQPTARAATGPWRPGNSEAIVETKTGKGEIKINGVPARKRAHAIMRQRCTTRH